MPVAPLVLTDPFATSRFEAAMLGMQVLKALLGIGIAYIAYRGYRENASRAMFFIAVGFALVLGIPFAILVTAIALEATTGLATAAEIVVAAVAEVSQVLGLLSIVHALRL